MNVVYFLHLSLTSEVVLFESCLVFKDSCDYHSQNNNWIGCNHNRICLWSMCNVSFNKSTFHTASFSDKYPSEQFCSISVRSNDLLLGSNVCNLPPDTVEVSCEMRFRDNSDLNPKLEWEVDGRRIQANESIRDDGTTVSSVHVSATDLRSSSLFVCRVKYRKNNDIQTNLIWSKRMNVTCKRL